MSDQTNNPFGIPGGGPIGIPGGAPQSSGPSLVKPTYVTPPPQAQPTGEAHVLAGWGARFGAHLLDIIVRLLITLPIPLLGFLIVADHPFSTVTIDPPDGISNLGGIAVTWVALYYLSGLLYAPIAMARLNGATVGKKMVGIRVVTDAGLTPSLGQAFVREPLLKGIVVNGIGGIFFVPALLSYLWPLWDPQSRAGHDFMAKTRVVRAT
ncbi:MAG: RDD family protein [Solirubrobacteraceae bacterium]|nr:RDD family protein [Patulibacter sp.]